MKKAAIFPDIHNHRALFMRVHQFNLLPTRYVHMSWLDDVTGALPMDMRALWRKNGRAERHCAAMIIKDFCRGFVYDFSDTVRRVVLLANAELVRLMIYAGMMIHLRAIRRTISGRHIRALSDAFGPDAYAFAATRAPLLAGLDGADGLQQPEVDIDQLPRSILENGRRCVETGLEGSPEPLVRRFCLKFPRKMSWDFTPHSDPVRQAACRRIIQKLLKMEICPSWQTVSP